MVTMTSADKSKNDIDYQARFETETARETSRRLEEKRRWILRSTMRRAYKQYGERTEEMLVHDTNEILGRLYWTDREFAETFPAVRSALSSACYLLEEALEMIRDENHDEDKIEEMKDFIDKHKYDY
jgi:hypothetical protein